MKITPSEIEKYIKRHPSATREELAVKFKVNVETIRRHTNNMGYVLKKVWVKNG